MSMSFYDFAESIREHDMSMFEGTTDPFGNGVFSNDDNDKKKSDGKKSSDGKAPIVNKRPNIPEKKIQPRNMFGEIIDSNSPFIWKHAMPYEIGDDGNEIEDATHLLTLSKSMVHDLNRMRNELTSNPSYEDIDKINKIATKYSRKYREDPDINLDKINSIWSARLGNNAWQKSDADYNADMVNDDAQQSSSNASLRQQEQDALTGMLTSGKRKGYGMDPNVLKWRKIRLQQKANKEARKKNANRAIEGLGDAKKLVVDTIETHPEIVGDWYFRQLPRILDRGFKMKQDNDEYTLDERITGRNNVHPKLLGRLTNAIFPGGKRGIVSSIGYAFGAKYFPVMEAAGTPTVTSGSYGSTAHIGVANAVLETNSIEAVNHVANNPGNESVPSGFIGDFGRDDNVPSVNEHTTPDSVAGSETGSEPPYHISTGSSGNIGSGTGTFRNAIKIIANSAAYYPENIRSWAATTIAPALKAGYEKLASAAESDRDRQYWQNRANAVHAGFLSRIKTAIAGESKKNVDDDLPGQPETVPSITQGKTPSNKPLTTSASKNLTGFEGETEGNVVERTDAPESKSFKSGKNGKPGEKKITGEKNDVPINKNINGINSESVPAIKVANSEQKSVPIVDKSINPRPDSQGAKAPNLAMPKQSQPPQYTQNGEKHSASEPAMPTPRGQSVNGNAQSPVQNQTPQTNTQSVVGQAHNLTHDSHNVQKRERLSSEDRDKMERIANNMMRANPQISSVLDSISGDMTMFESQKYNVPNIVGALTHMDDTEDTAERNARIIGTCNGRTMTTRINSEPIGYTRSKEKNWRLFYED